MGTLARGVRVFLAHPVSPPVFRSSATRSFSVSSRRRSASQPRTYDVVIVGGGPAGLALATALGSQPSPNHPLSIALVEASDLGRIRSWDPRSTEFSNRVVSITNASRAFLTDIGAWQYVDESRTAPIETMEVWDGLSDSRIVFSGPDLDVDTLELARLTEVLNLQRALLLRLQGLSERVSVLDAMKVESIEESNTDDGWPVVKLSSGESLRARLLVGADGFKSPVRTYAGIDSYGWKYPTHAVVATLQHPSTATLAPESESDYEPDAPTFIRQNTAAYQRFLQTGPIAFLPLDQQTSSMVWSTTPPLAAILKVVKPAVLAALINAAFRLPDASLRYINNYLLDRAESAASITLDEIQSEIAHREGSHHIDASSPLYSSSLSMALTGVPPIGSLSFPPLIEGVQPGTQAGFPLKLSHATEYVKGSSRVALVGDAAHTVHPLAGQGLNMGIADVEALADVIQETLSLGGDIGGQTPLLSYHKARYIPNHAILSVTDKLHKIYSLSSPPVVWARSVGVEVLNELSSFKGAIMGAAGSSETSSFHSSPTYAGTVSTGWDAAARGVEIVNGALKLGKLMVESVGSTTAKMVTRATNEISNSNLRP